MTINDIALEHVYDFMEKGSLNNAPQEIVDYLQMLDKIRGMFLRIDTFGTKESIVKHLMLVDKLSRYKAMQLCDEAQEYFYSESKISKQAWRNIYAEKAEKMVLFAMQTVKNPTDAAKVVKMLLDMAELRGVNLPDVEELPAEIFQPPWVIYSADAEFLGLETKANRNELAKMIDAFPELTEKQRNQIKREAQILPLKVFPNEQEDGRKS
jgi:hypothetical protein